MSEFNELITKYNNLERREKNLLHFGAIVLLTFLLFILIYKPLNNSITKLEISNSKNQELLVWITQAVGTLKGSTGTVNKTDKRRGRDLNVIINTTASSSSISISRSQPRDNNQYQIWLDKAMFNDLLLWLSVLHKDYGIFVSSINLGVTEVKGQVRVNLTFQDSGS